MSRFKNIIMSKFEKFKKTEINLEGVFGGMNETEGTGECNGTGCVVDTSGDGKVKDWDDVECGDNTVGKNSGKCDPVA